MVGKAQKSHGARSGLYGRYFNEVPLIHVFQAEHRIHFISCPHAISAIFQPRKGSSEARNFEVISGLQHVFKKWVEHCKKRIVGQGMYLKKDTFTAPPQCSNSE
jgi:hypothetical protein